MNALIGLFIILALLLAGCNVPATDLTDKNLPNITPTKTTSKPSPSTEPSGDMEDAPIGLIFESFDDMQAFQAASMGTNAEYLEYLDTAKLSMNISQDLAQKFAMFLSSQQYPTQIGTNTQTDFGGVYYLDRNVLDLTIKTNSIRYRFIYYFGQDPELTFTGTPVISNVDLGIAKLDFYQDDGALVGTYRNQNALVQVIAYTENPNSVALDSFRFASIK